MPLHLFGAGHPLTMSLAVALGCDTFDSASYIIFARTGRYMSRSGVMTLQSMKYLPCSCPVCSKSTVKELLELEQAERTKRLATHNLYVLREELEACKEAISEGRLWDLVQERSMAHPRLREAFVEMAKYSADLSAGTPRLKERGLFVRSALDLKRPEVVGAAARLLGAMNKSSRRARLLTSGTSEPERSRRAPGKDDLYRNNPVLGPFPIELEFQYPFSQTEVAAVVPSVGVDEAKKRLRGLGYSTVLAGRERKVRSKRSRRAPSPSLPSASARSR
jgi:7-cyano-7-deazaguanine tRNA-ribosyltransferase